MLYWKTLENEVYSFPPWTGHASSDREVTLVPRRRSWRQADSAEKPTRRLFRGGEVIFVPLVELLWEMPRGIRPPMMGRMAKRMAPPRLGLPPSNGCSNGLPWANYLFCCIWRCPFGHPLEDPGRR